MDTKSVRVRISGQVQGVFFRVWTMERAEALGVIGWIRNRLDGDVEGLFVGPTEAVEALIEACRSGPPSAVVDDIKIEPVQGITSARFEIKPTV